jgi:hypothetical protein
MLIGIKWERVLGVESSPFLQSEKNFSEKGFEKGTRGKERRKSLHKTIRVQREKFLKLFGAVFPWLQV